MAIAPKRRDESEMDVVIRYSDNTYYETKDEFDSVLEQWIRMILNKYGASIEDEC